jgi:hypothetical protein
MVENDKIKKYFLTHGYSELPLAKAPQSLSWQPNLLFTKDGFIFPVLIKTNNTIPPAYLNRIGQISNDKLVPIILFAQKTSGATENEILTLGISIGYIINGAVSDLKIRKRVPRRVIQKEIKKKLTVIDIFVSSRQEIEERPFVEGRLEMLRKTQSYPFNPPILIEHDRFKLTGLNRYIDEKMGGCDWVIHILEDEHSDPVNYEIKKAIKTINHDNIFMFVKSTAKCKKAWKNELDLIKGLPGKTIKYIEYSNLTDLEIYLIRAINKKMDEIQKKKGIKIYQ